MLDKQKIIRVIQEMAKKLGRAPSVAEFTKRSKISRYFVLKWFRSWTEAVRAAGLHPSARNARIEDGVLLEEWGRAVRKNGGVQPRHEFRRAAKYNPLTLANRFGGWSAVPQAFWKFARGKREWADVVALLLEHVRGGRGGEENAASVWGSPAIFRTGGNGCGGVSCTAEAARCGRRGRWYEELEDRPVCGNPLEFRWLTHEPVNEQGVVLLFGMLARDLGYAVENVQKGFPDCEAKRQIGPGRWQRVRIEFEYESRNFCKHGHPSKGCDVIVCWRDNWAGRPERVEVLELSRVMRGIGRERTSATKDGRAREQLLYSESNRR